MTQKEYTVFQVGLLRHVVRDPLRVVENPLKVVLNGISVELTLIVFTNKIYFQKSNSS